MKLNLKRPIIFFDLETTGVDTARDRIVEISMVKVMPDGEEIRKTRRLNPGMHIPAEATAVHGITDEDVKDCPTFAQVAKSLEQFIRGCDFGGFNSNRFDLPVLVEEFLRAGVDVDFKRRKFIDVQNIFHKKEQRTLVAAYKFYCDKELDDAHSAEATRWPPTRCCRRSWTAIPTCGTTSTHWPNTPRAASAPTMPGASSTTSGARRSSGSASTRDVRWRRFSASNRATTPG